jgi:excisionase family DNA binding protein
VKEVTEIGSEPRYLSLGGAARYTTLSVGTLRRLLREGKLRGFRPSGRRVLIDRAELDALVRASAATTTATAAGP